MRDIINFYNDGGVLKVMFNNQIYVPTEGIEFNTNEEGKISILGLLPSVLITDWSNIQVNGKSFKTAEDTFEAFEAFMESGFENLPKEGEVTISKGVATIAKVEPNTNYVIDEPIDGLTITEVEVSTMDANISFTTGDTGFDITLSSGQKYSGNLTLDAETEYLINAYNGVLYIAKINVAE